MRTSCNSDLEPSIMMRYDWNLEWVAHRVLDSHENLLASYNQCKCNYIQHTYYNNNKILGGRTAVDRFFVLWIIFFMIVFICCILKDSGKVVLKRYHAESIWQHLWTNPSLMCKTNILTVHFDFQYELLFWSVWPFLYS